MTLAAGRTASEASSFAEVTDLPLDPSALLSQVGSDTDGARILFVGVVRNHADGRSVDGVTYEAYRDMAERVLHEIVSETARELGRGCVAAQHRTGSLRVGEASVAIAVSSPHRAEAYRASRRVIEEIKIRLPMWKYESYVDGSREWVRGERPEAPSSADEVGP